MTVRVGIIMDPIAQIAFKKDSSLAMLLAAQARSWTLFYMEQRDLYQLGNQARARMRSLQVFDDPQHWFETGEEVDMALADLDVILMRKDPPFNSEYVYATYLLELAEKAGTLLSFRSAHRRPWSAYAPTFSASLPTSTVTSFSNPWTKWAAPRSSVIARATPICP